MYIFKRRKKLLLLSLVGIVLSGEYIQIQSSLVLEILFLWVDLNFQKNHLREPSIETLILKINLVE